MTEPTIPLRKIEQASVIQALGLGVVAFPHLRVGQLIYNAVDTYMKDNNRPLPDDHFHISDVDMAAALYAYIANYKREEL